MDAVEKTCSKRSGSTWRRKRAMERGNSKMERDWKRKAKYRTSEVGEIIFLKGDIIWPHCRRAERKKCVVDIQQQQDLIDELSKLLKER